MREVDRETSSIPHVQSVFLLDEPTVLISLPGVSRAAGLTPPFGEHSTRAKESHLKSCQDVQFIARRFLFS